MEIRTSFPSGANFRRFAPKVLASSVAVTFRVERSMTENVPSWESRTGSCERIDGSPSTECGGPLGEMSEMGERRGGPDRLIEYFPSAQRSQSVRSTKPQVPPPVRAFLLEFGYYAASRQATPDSDE